MSTSKWMPLLLIITGTVLLGRLLSTASPDDPPLDSPGDREVSEPIETLQSRLTTYLEKAAPGWMQFTDETNYGCKLVDGWFFTYEQPDEPGVTSFDGGHGVFITRRGLVYLFGLGGSGLWCDIVTAPNSDEDAEQSFRLVVGRHGGSTSDRAAEPPVHLRALVYSPRLDSSANSDSLMAFFAEDDYLLVLQRFGSTAPSLQESNESSQ